MQTLRLVGIRRVRVLPARNGIHGRARSLIGYLYITLKGRIQARYSPQSTRTQLLFGILPRHTFDAFCGLFMVRHSISPIEILSHTFMYLLSGPASAVFVNTVESYTWFDRADRVV